MKTKTPKVTISQIISDVEASGKDGFLFVGTSYKKTPHLSLIVVANGVLKTFSTPIRKQGSGKRENAAKVKRFYVSKSWWILTPEKIEEVDLRKHEFDSLPTDKLIKEKFVEVFRAKLKYSYPEYCLFRNLFKYTVNKISEKEIDVPEAVEATVSEAPNNNEDVKVPEETTPVVRTAEDIFIDELADLESTSKSPICKGFVDRLLNLSGTGTTLTLIDELRHLDLTYFHAQEMCHAMTESNVEIENMQAAFDMISKFIVGLTTITYELNNKLEDAKACKYMQEKSVEKNTEAVTKLYSEIDAEISKIEEENSEKAKAEAKVSDIMANLSDTEREILMKALGLKPEVTMAEEVTVADTEEKSSSFVITMTNGDTKTISREWSSIQKHIRQVQLKHETINKEIVEYIAEQLNSGMSRKELGEFLGSKHYATVVVGWCVAAGLYTIDGNVDPFKYTRTISKEKVDAIKKGAETRRTLSRIKKKAIEEDLLNKF